MKQNLNYKFSGHQLSFHESPLFFRCDHGNVRSHGTSPPFFSSIFLNCCPSFLDAVMGEACPPLNDLFCLFYIWARTELTEGPCEGLEPKVTLTPLSLRVHIICPIRRGASAWEVVSGAADRPSCEPLEGLCTGSLQSLCIWLRFDW